MYDHYIAIDWAQASMVIARQTKAGQKTQIIERQSEVTYIKAFLKSLKGRKILTFEESTTSQWLYVELKSCVDKVLVCDPRRNYYLSEGPKNDKIDAKKLVQLLRADLLKEVYHCSHRFFELRKLVSSYIDLVKACVRVKNQRSAIYRAKHFSIEELEKNSSDRFTLDSLERQVNVLENEIKQFKGKFDDFARNEWVMHCLTSIPGFGNIIAVKIIAIVVNIQRFKSISHFWSYCGLVKHDRISGGKLYGRKNTRYSRVLKEAIKTATMSALNAKANNPVKIHYQYKLSQGLAPHSARNSCARYLARCVFGVLKSKKPFKGERKCKLQA